jgi:hypothetical protein
VVQKTKKVFLGLLVSIVIGSSVTWYAVSPAYALTREYKVVSFFVKHLPKVVNTLGIYAIQLSQKKSKLTEKESGNPLPLHMYVAITEMCRLPQYKMRCARTPLSSEIKKMIRYGEVLLKKHSNNCLSLLKVEANLQNINHIFYALLHCSSSQSTGSTPSKKKVSPKPHGKTENPLPLTDTGGAGKPPPKYDHKSVCIQNYQPREFEDERSYKIMKTIVYFHVQRLLEALGWVEQDIKKFKNDANKINSLKATRAELIAEKNRVIHLFRMLELCEAYHETPGYLKADTIKEIIDMINNSQYKPLEPITSGIHDPKNVQMNLFIREYGLRNIKKHQF